MGVVVVGTVGAAGGVFEPGTSGAGTAAVVVAAAFVAFAAVEGTVAAAGTGTGPRVHRIPCLWCWP